MMMMDACQVAKLPRGSLIRVRFKNMFKYLMEQNLGSRYPTKLAEKTIFLKYFYPCTW